MSEKRDHADFCASNELDLCTGCSVKKGWQYSGMSGVETTCRDGKPHEWLPKACNCGTNDRRKGDRRNQRAPAEGETEKEVRGRFMEIPGVKSVRIEDYKHVMVKLHPYTTASRKQVYEVEQTIHADLPEFDAEFATAPLDDVERAHLTGDTQSEGEET